MLFQTKTESKTIQPELRAETMTFVTKLAIENGSGLYREPRETLSHLNKQANTQRKHQVATIRIQSVYR